MPYYNRDPKGDHDSDNHPCRGCGPIHVVILQAPAMGDYIPPQNLMMPCGLLLALKPHDAVLLRFYQVWGLRPLDLVFGIEITGGCEPQHPLQASDLIP